MPSVGQPDAAERDVAYHQVEGAFGGTGAGERLVADFRARVKGCRDLSGDRLQLPPGDMRAGGGEGDEVPGSAAGLEHPSGGEAELLNARPDCLDQVSVGVVGVEGVARGGGQFLGL